MNPESEQERRRHRRFKPTGEAYAVFRAPGPILGQIIDISEGGLSILYVEGEEPPMEVIEFDLFTLDNDVRVDAIAAVSRSDSQLSDRKESKPDITRRRGIEFVGLRNRQKEAVRGLIRKQADGRDQ